MSQWTLVCGNLHPDATDHSMSIRGAGVTAQQRWSLLYGREKYHLPADSHTKSVRWPAPSPACFSTKRAFISSFLIKSYHPCISVCGRYLAPQDGHDYCLTCLGIQNAEEAFVDGSCSSCGDMTMVLSAPSGAILLESA